MSENNNQEKRCPSCGRTEKEAGKFINMPNNLYVCQDCMRKSFDMLGGIFGDLEKLNLRPQEEVKKEEEKEKSEKEESSIVKMLKDFKDIPKPQEIKEMLDQYVIGQERAKKIISVAVYNHYKRLSSKIKEEQELEILKKAYKKLSLEELHKKRCEDSLDPFSDVELEKSNILMIGPTGSGKTYLVKTLARLLKVPLAIADATTLTEAGYIGDDVESIVQKLLTQAGGDVFKTECGIIFVDEIDKIARKADERTRDIRGESVQQAMLKLLEGSIIEVPTASGMTAKMGLAPTKKIDTSNILFICGGAFSGLEEVIAKRVNKSAAIGFDSTLKEDSKEEKNLLTKTTVEDLREFGMIPEFLGRLPIMCTLHSLDEEMLVRILKEPKNSISRQYQKLFYIDDVKLTFTEEAYEEIAKLALEKQTGARAIRAIMENLMTDLMYEIPKDKNIGEVVITKEYVKNEGSPKLIMKNATICLP